MLATVDFHNKPSVPTGEIGDVVLDDELPFPLQAIEAPVTQALPKLQLGIG